MQPKQIKKWKWLYFSVAFLDLLAVGISLAANHHLGNQYSEALRVNSVWASRLESLDQLQTLAAEVNAPGNDVFDSREAKKERQRMVEAKSKFTDHYARLWTDLNNSNFQSENEKKPIVLAASKIPGQLEQMTEKAEEIFYYFKIHQKYKADSEMARMDRMYYSLREAIAATAQEMRALQAHSLEKQKHIRNDIQFFETIFSIFIFIMICGILFYGNAMSKFVAVVLEDKKHFEELNTALNAAAIVATTDIRGKIKHVNRKFEEITGYTKDELIGKDHRILNSKYHSKDFFKDMWSKITNGEIWHAEIKNKKKDGSEYWVDSTIVPMKNSSGKIWQYVAIRSEITARKEMEIELQRSRKKIDLMLQVAQIANRSESVNQAIQETLEVICKKAKFSLGHAYIVDPADTNSLKSSGLWYLTNPKKFEEFKTLTEGFRFQRGEGLPGKAWSGSAAIWINDIFTEPFFLRNQFLKDKNLHAAFAFPIHINNKIRAVLEFFSEDISLRNNMILEVADQIALYLGQVYQREETALIIQKQRDLAETAARTKASFLANMSHEIRTPMNGIIGMTNLLLGSSPDAICTERLRIIQNCGTSLLELINDVLDFSKLEVDKIELENEPFPLHGTVNEIVELLNTRASEKGIILSYKHAENVPPWIRGDITRFRQILTNLISNAIKFTQNGRVDISSSVIQSENPRQTIQFSVKDTGIGIPHHLKSRLFQSFSQVDASTTRRFGGSGLGLAIAKGLCEKMGGSIWVDSEVGKGSTFSFTFISETSDPIAKDPSSSPFSTIDPEMGKKHPLEILLAEDNRTNQLVAIGFLGKLGYQADIAANGLEVMSALEHKNYDLILMDCHMPEMDGFETTTAIRQKFKSQPRIVALTASTTKEDLDRCFAVGMDTIISKPIELTALITTLREVKATKDKVA